MSWPPRSRLFQRALTPREDDLDGSSRDRLRFGLADLRKRADVLASRIELDLPDFTEHDGTHIDALWTLADRFLPAEEWLTPAEAFVFGSAVVLHDLGLPLAAYQGGVKHLRSDPIWKETIVALLRRQLHRAPTETDISEAPSRVVRQADMQVLRIRHASQAESMLAVPWLDKDDRERWLLQDEDLRGDFAYLIGRIAGSHHWPASSLSAHFHEVTMPPGGYPPEWTLRPLLLACLLRVADAAHLDGERAPRWAQLHRAVSADAEPHWEFQQRLGQAEVVGDQIRFQSLEPFTPNQANSWWTCFEALEVLDAELRSCDQILARTSLPRLLPHGVRDIDTPEALARSVEVSGWHPVDVNVTATDVGYLVRTLGGTALYGDQSMAPLRELLANAIDSVRLRELVNHTLPPEVVVRLEIHSEPVTLEVIDNGMGMSQHIISTALLNFGNSMWTDPHANLIPGRLTTRDFSPIGRFGIGFFSVFMWTDHPRVVSWPIERARDEMRLLEFPYGIDGRPLLREPPSDEQLASHGSAVKLQLNNRHTHLLVSALPPQDRQHTCRHAMTELMASLAALVPAPEVDIVAQVGDKTVTVARGGDWTEIEPSELLTRIAGKRRPHRLSGEQDSEAAINYVTEAMMPIIDQRGTTLARAALIPPAFQYTTELEGALVTGGVSVKRLTVIAGVWSADSPNLARTEATPVVPSDLVAQWATAQAQILSRWLSPKQQPGAAQRVLYLGGEPGELKLVHTSDGPRSYSELASAIKVSTVIGVVSDGTQMTKLKEIVTQDRPGERSLLIVADGRDVNEEELRRLAGLASKGLGLIGLVEQAICEAWSISTDELASAMLVTVLDGVDGPDDEDSALVRLVDRPKR